MTATRDSLTGVAIDLGGTKIAAGRIVAGKIVATRRVATDGTVSSGELIGRIADLAISMGAGPNVAVGVAVAGLIDAAGVWSASNATTLRHLEDTPLAAALTGHLGTPVTCLNDADAAGLAEARFGAGCGAENFAYITISTGVGGGLVLGGRLLTNATGLAGHVGFVTTAGSSAVCGSGRHGTVESVAGGQAMEVAARAIGQHADARAICDAAREHVPWAESIVARSAGAVAGLIADLTAILGLDRIALGGSIGLSDGYIERVIAALATEPPLFQVPVCRAALGLEAPLFGVLEQRCRGRSD